MRILRHEDGTPSKGSNIEGSDYRTLGDTKRFSIRTVVLMDSQSTKYHSHPGEEIYIILQGEGVVIDGKGNISRIRAGEAAYFSVEEFHAMGCPTGGEKLRFLSITTPPIAGDVEFRPLPKDYTALTG